MVTITDYYDKPFEYDVEKYSIEGKRRVVKVDEDGNEYNDYADYHPHPWEDFLDPTYYIHVYSVLKDIFKYDGRSGDFLSFASKDRLYLLSKLGETSADYLGWRVSNEPLYLSEGEFVDKILESQKLISMVNPYPIHMECWKMCYEVDKNTVAYNQYPRDTLKSIIYTAALVVRKVPPYLAEAVSHSNDLRSKLNRWWLNTDLDVKHFFQELDKQLEKRK